MSEVLEIMHEELNKYRSEKEAVMYLGEAIGYGNVMQLCSILWRESLIAKGYPPQGAFRCTCETDTEIARRVLQEGLQELAKFPSPAYARGVMRHAMMGRMPVECKVNLSDFDIDWLTRHGFKLEKMENGKYRVGWLDSREEE